MLSKSIPIEMRMSVREGIQTWDNLAHLLQIGSFSRNISSKLKSANISDNSRSFEILSKNFLYAANSSASKITLLNRTQEFLEGDAISFRVDVFNGFHQPYKKGGHDVRVWLTDHLERRSATSSVVDLGNGSYLANFKAMFSGTLDVQASIMYPLEYLQLMFSMVDNCISGYASALFEKDGYKEVSFEACL